MSPAATLTLAHQLNLSNAMRAKRGDTTPAVKPQAKYLAPRFTRGSTLHRQTR